MTYTASDLERATLDCRGASQQFYRDAQRRSFVRCEPAAVVLSLECWRISEIEIDSPHRGDMIQTPRDAVEYILEIFLIVKSKDIKRTTLTDESGQVTQPGTYITKDTILSIYDAMTESIRTGVPYQTRLDLPPGPPTDADGNFIPMSEWSPSSWPSHIHPRRNE